MEWLRKFYSDNKALLSLKAVVFFYYGAVFSLMPYLGMHMKDLGLSVQDRSLEYALILLASFIGPPIGGFIADKWGHYKRTFVATLAATALLHNSLLLVPAVLSIYRPLKSELICTDTGGFLIVENCLPPIVRAEDPLVCSVTEEAIHDGITHTPVSSCRYECKYPGVAEEHETKVAVCFKSEKGVRSCEEFDSTSSQDGANFSIVSIAKMFEGRRQCAYRIQTVQLSDREPLSYAMHCPSPAPFRPTTAPTTAPRWRRPFRTTAAPVVRSYCRLMCEAPPVNSNNGSVLGCLEPPDATHTGLMYFILRHLSMLALGASFPLMEAAILILIRQHGGEYGKQRLWSHVASAIFTPVAGMLIDTTSNANDAPGRYYPAFLLFNGLLLTAAIITIFGLSVPLKAQPKLQIVRDMIQVSCQREMLLLYGAVLFLGAFWGFLETFLFWFLMEIGSSKFLLGFSRTVGGLICIPIMFFADTIMAKVGRVNILVAAFICYSLQMLCYSLIGNPWWAVALEMLKIVTSCLKVASMVTLASSLSSQGLVGTTQGTIRSLHYEIGSGLGIILGGAISDSYGPRAALQILGVASGLLGITYAIMFYTMRSQARKVPATTPEEFRDISLHNTNNGET